MEKNEFKQKINPKSKHRFWIMIIIIIAVLAIGFGVLAFSQQTLSNNNPRFIQADFIDLDQIFSISKFRSGSGHDFSSNDETCRSMKHYFNVQDNKEKFTEWEQNNGRPLPPSSGKAIDIFSPVDGKIINIEEEQTPIGKQVYIKPNKAPAYTIRLFHIYLLPQFKEGYRLVAGEKIGEIGEHQNTDIAIQKGAFRGKFISYFEVMPDSIFAKYKARGAANRDDFIIAKKYRDSHPLKCNGEQFAENYENDQDNFVRLSGYLSPDF